MANLNVENLGNIVQSGNTEQLFGNGAASEFRVAREMEAQGMQPPSESAGEAGHSFADMLKDSVNKVNEMQTQADTAINELVAGRYQKHPRNNACN